MHKTSLHASFLANCEEMCEPPYLRAYHGIRFDVLVREGMHVEATGILISAARERPQPTFEALRKALEGLGSEIVKQDAQQSDGESCLVRAGEEERIGWEADVRQWAQGCGSNAAPAPSECSDRLLSVTDSSASWSCVRGCRVLFLIDYPCVIYVGGVAPNHRLSAMARVDPVADAMAGDNCPNE